MSKWKITLKKVPRSKKYLRVNEDDFKKLYMTRFTSDLFGCMGWLIIGLFIAGLTNSPMFWIYSGFVIMVIFALIFRIAQFGDKGYTARDIIASTDKPLFVFIQSLK